MNTAGAGPMLLALMAGSLACAQPLPPYQPEQKISGTIRTWGSVQMGRLLQLWQKGFSKHQPGVQFENHLKGAVSAIAGVYTGVADLAISREIWPLKWLPAASMSPLNPIRWRFLPTKAIRFHN
jgi:ABC-type phosphate transport system substrate-binding protein